MLTSISLPSPFVSFSLSLSLFWIVVSIFLRDSSLSSANHYGYGSVYHPHKIPHTYLHSDWIRKMMIRNCYSYCLNICWRHNFFLTYTEDETQHTTLRHPAPSTLTQHEISLSESLCWSFFLIGRIFTHQNRTHFSIDHHQQVRDTLAHMGWGWFNSTWWKTGCGYPTSISMKTRQSLNINTEEQHTTDDIRCMVARTPILTFVLAFAFSCDGLIGARKFLLFPIRLCFHSQRTKQVRNLRNNTRTHTFFRTPYLLPW